MIGRPYSDSRRRENLSLSAVLRCSDAKQNLKREKKKERERRRREGEEGRISSAGLRRILRDITYSFLPIRNSSKRRGREEKKRKPGGGKRRKKNNNGSPP